MKPLATLPAAVLAWLLFAPAASAAAATAEPAPDPAIDLFVKKCASCHTIGKGDRVGPDLAGAHERRDRAWLARFIEVPSAMLDTDAVARDLVVKFKGTRMPDLGLSAEQARSLVDLVARCSASPCDLAPAFKPVTAAVPDDAVRGRLLYLGTEPLSGGGPACLSCHTVRGAGGGVGGGLLAKDLTNVFARLGDEALGAALANPAFPLMANIYADKPDEAFALRAFLYEANRATAPDDDSVNPLLFGTIGAGAVLLVLNAAWSRRLRGVRSSIAHGRRSR